MTEIGYRTGGPARYVTVEETGGRLGFITPMTHNFCESCNRVRLTCTGTLYMCLGQNAAAATRSALRASEDNGLLHTAIDEAITLRGVRYCSKYAFAARAAVSEEGQPR